MTTAAYHELAAAHWLLSAHPEPSKALQEWLSDDGLVLLPLGTLFSAVRIPAHLVHAAAGSEDPAVVDEFLTEDLFEKPVICDPRGSRYYALVLAGTARTWRDPRATCLGRGSYLVVPRPDSVHPTTHESPYWSVPMSSAAELCGHYAVAQLVAVGAHLTTEEDPA